MKRREIWITIMLWITAFVSTVPYLWVFMSSFKSNVEIFRNPFALPGAILWENYTKTWFVGRFNLYFGNSFWVAIPTVAIVVALSTMAGYAFARIRFRFRNTLMTVLLFGLTVPAHSLIIPIYKNMRSLGLVDSRFGLALILVGFGLPYSVLMMRSFFISKPEELADAGRIDGCSEYGVFFYVMLPLAKPAILALTTIQFTWAWKAFLLPLILLHTDAKRTIPLGLMFYRGEAGLQYALLAAGVVISSLPILVVYGLTSRYFVQGVTAGSVKG